jgi:hypothetical protein
MIVTKTVTDKPVMDEEAQKLLNEVVSRLGLEPRALALKALSILKKINAMILRNRPMSDKHLQRVTVCVSYIGQPRACRCHLRPGFYEFHELQPQTT